MADNKKEQERAELHRTIWGIANDLRGSVDGWDFKQYVLGILFYRYISENLTGYINAGEREAGDAVFDYAKLSDQEAEQAREDLVATKGFFILPSELFENVHRRASNDENLNETLEKIFKNIEASAQGSNSEDNFKGLFDDIDVNSNKLGSTVAKRNEKLVKLLNGVGEMKLGDYKDNTIDAFGDAYEFLMGMYASNAGKSGGEYYTPQEVSELLTRLTLVGKTEVNKVYDPACGSGSLLLKFAKILGKENVRLGFFGQEINITTYNLCRINMFLHDIDYDKFDIGHGNTLTDPLHWDDEPFEAIVSNPPYSIKWDGDNNPLLINDPRFSPAGVLAPKSKADLAFIMHSLSWLATNGTAAIVCFPGILYRGGAEQKIRKYLIDNNFVDCVIQLPGNLFYGTSIATCIMVLKKSKSENSTLFIDASRELIKVTNSNKLTDENIIKIIAAYEARTNENYFVRLVNNDDIAAQDYNLTVSSYVKQEDKREAVDIGKLNAEIEAIVALENVLRAEIATIIADLEGVSNSLLTFGDDVKQFTLGEVFDMKAGKGIQASDISSAENDEFAFPCYGGNGLRGYVKQPSHNGKFVIIGRQGALCGNVKRVIGEFYATEHAVVVTAKPGINIDWAFHILSTMNLNQYATKSAQPGLSVGKIETLTISVPPITDQERIVAILDRFDTLVNDITQGLPAEISARRKQYEYYRDKLLTFKGIGP